MALVKAFLIILLCRLLCLGQQRFFVHALRNDFAEVFLSIVSSNPSLGQGQDTG